MLLLFAGNCLAQTIATCRNPSGWDYYHNTGIVSKNDGGWTKSTITNGLMTIQRLGDGNYDILIADAKTKTARSMAGEGGQVIILRRGDMDATFMYYYPGQVIELFTIYQDGAGISRYDMLQSKGGDYMPFLHKSGVMTGLCDNNIRFDLIK